MNKAKKISDTDGQEFLRSAFSAEQEVLKVQLQFSVKSVTHDGKMGEVNEKYFIDVLRKYSPKRYAINSAFVIDSNGRTSDQIDIVIYDQQYTPTLLNQHDHHFVPAEAVYAVFEVKPLINSKNMRYAGGKAESVRILERTSIPIPQLSIKQAAKKPVPIISGIIATDINWPDGFNGKTFLKNYNSLLGNNMLDCGFVATGGCFDSFDGELKIGPEKNSLAFFIFRLLKKLQSCGNPPSTDWNKYALIMSNEKP